MEELKKALYKKNDENDKFYTDSKIIDYLKVCLILLDHTCFTQMVVLRARKIL